MPCIFAGLLLAFACTQIVSGGVGLFSYYFLSSLLYILLIKRSETRSEVLGTVFPLVVGLFLAYAGTSLMDFKGLAHVSTGVPFVLVSGLFSLLFLLAFSPIAEMLFGYTSRFRLMELMNLEQPLLQDLMVNAPGTYHHSLIVSNMVEAGARAIGASPLLAKVAGLYHDIGKLKNPQYFIENQFARENKHDKLTPSMSSLILISHVKKGVELAKAHNIGQEIIDIIVQHHGTSLIAYFYNKAHDMSEGKGEVPREEDYRYPGPKPQTKEAGLILLADAIEASARTLVDPTPARIRGHIEKMIRKIFQDGELDESELTLKDLHLAADTFHRILTGIFHHRIEYPGPRSEPPKPGPGEQGPSEPGGPLGPGGNGKPAGPLRPVGAKSAA
jgi:putative nucleotidyltransferase with HDIG domain